ncbi:Aquaporin Z [Actinacidiphila bryophytorum]|jgi:aquaporin Z|uniref:Aquaporin Z n=2 Tax=Actinacidiphila bryophytorum TaxID=1436133 RepID=A0A9W4H7T7_9ACTN|nr:MIP family channel protein [Actinacidiphila bryophytorum]UWE09334.1 MIP family channel protein [Actinacidiphila bryophytorum]CAG7656725.1 Aquaporin Z [Actinacidiphila bryophytorum]
MDMRTITENRTPDDQRAFVCEFLGTMALVFFAVGAAVLSGEYIGTLGIALAFGLVLLAIAYAVGPISGSHVNPAVTLGMLFARRITLRTAVEYWIAQFLGAIVGAALLLLVAKQVPGLQTHGAFGTNGYGYRSAVGINIFGAFVAEVILTFLLVFVVLAVTHRIAVVGFDGLPIGMALAVVHLIGIPLTGTGVNPARSLAPALFAGSPALTQVWLFLVAPPIGAILAALAHEVTHPALAAVRAARAAAAEAETAARAAGEEG